MRQAPESAFMISQIILNTIITNYNYEKRGEIRMMKNKRAQFYLIAAAIIIVIIAGLYAAYNYISRNPVVFYDLSGELSREGASVVDHGIWKSIDINILMKNFTEDYFSKYAEEKDTTELVYIYGDTNHVYVTTYKSSNAGSICIGFGGGGCTNIIRSGVTTESRGSATSIQIDSGNQRYNFNIQSGQNFYFVIKQEIGDESKISQN